MSAKICDHKSVGMLVVRDGKLLLIERKKYPFGFAPPAGHVDDDQSYEAAARRELEEEVGLTAEECVAVWSDRKENPCRREDGTWHDWVVYFLDSSGEINRSQDETKQAGWYSETDIRRLMNRAREYQNKQISDDEWEKSPGLEIVWFELFHELPIAKIIGTLCD